jgi:transposase
MLHAGLDLSRKKLDVCLLSDEGEIVDEFAVPPDVDGLAGLVRRVGPEPPQAVIESMTGARFVHDRLEELGWDVRIADAAKVKGIGPLAAKTDKIDARVLAVLSQRDLSPRSGCRAWRSAKSVSSRASGCIWSSTARCLNTASTRR